MTPRTPTPLPPQPDRVPTHLPANVPANLRANPRLSLWVQASPDDRGDAAVTIHTGKADLGQGVHTALAQIAASELGIGIDRVRVLGPDTHGGPNEGMTSGSLSVQESGAAIRQACAQWRLQPGTERIVEAVVAEAPRSSPVGESIARLDLPPKVRGEPMFIHDLQLPGLLHGRVWRPGAEHARGAQLQHVDADAVRACPGVLAVVRDGDFVGLVARDEHQADEALRVLARACTWRDGPGLAPLLAPDFLTTAPRQTTALATPSPTEPATADSASAAHVLEAVYERPFLAHASIGPSCALARWTPESATTPWQVWTHSQGVFHLQADLALLLGVPAAHIRVRHVPGAGCYGHNGADDVAADAVLLARAVPGHPVRVRWSRADELGWSPFGPAMRVRIAAQVQLASDGPAHAVPRIQAWQHEVWSNGHALRPGRATVPVLLAATQIEPPPGQRRADWDAAQLSQNMPMAVGGGAERNAIPGYTFGGQHVVSHRLLTMPLRTSALRSLGAHANVFAIESFLDEIARACDGDPLALRLAHLADTRAQAVLVQAAQLARWSDWLARSAATRQADADAGRGLGMAYARYKNTGAWLAAVAQVVVQDRVRVEQLWLAVDVGTAINPDGVRNQIEGGALQALSWTLHEAVRFDDKGVLSTGWGHYPILRFSDVPQVHVHLMAHPDDAPPLGAGEAAQGPVSAAIANAVCDALGLRVRRLPIDGQALLAAAGTASAG